MNAHPKATIILTALPTYPSLRATLACNKWAFPAELCLKILDSNPYPETPTEKTRNFWKPSNGSFVEQQGPPTNPPNFGKPSNAHQDQANRGADRAEHCAMPQDEPANTRSRLTVYLVVSQNRGPQYSPQNTIVLIMGTPKMVPLILGNPQFLGLHDS